jgi:hypothetical protein
MIELKNPRAERANSSGDLSLILRELIPCLHLVLQVPFNMAVEI